MVEPYWDMRSARWRDWFSAASDYETYLRASEPSKADRWRAAEQRLPALSRQERDRVSGYRRRVNLLMVSGVWCGDCVRQGTMIRQIAEACGRSARLRIIDRDKITELRDEVRILGAERIPVLVFLTEDFFEVGRFGDRMLSTYRKKAQNEIGAACPVPSALVPDDEIRQERGEWLDIFERMLLMLRLAPPLRRRYAD